SAADSSRLLRFLMMTSCGIIRRSPVFELVSRIPSSDPRKERVTGQPDCLHFDRRDERGEEGDGWPCSRSLAVAAPLKSPQKVGYKRSQVLKVIAAFLDDHGGAVKGGQGGPNSIKRLAREVETA